MSKEKHWNTFRKPGDLLLKTTLKITRKTVSLEANYKETRGVSRLVVYTANLISSPGIVTTIIC